MALAQSKSSKTADGFLRKGGATSVPTASRLGMLASIDGADDPSYLLGDGLRSVRGVTDDTGALTGTADYAVFGEVRASRGVSTLFRFTGEQFDAETGFTYLRARYLSPALGRFVSADTVQPNAPGTQGWNLYAYVANNPTTWVDPSGHLVDIGAEFNRWLTRIWVVATACIIVVPGCGTAVAEAKVDVPRKQQWGIPKWAKAGILLAVCPLIPACRELLLKLFRFAERIGDLVQPKVRTNPKPDPKPDCSKVPVSPPLSEDVLTNHIVAGHAKGVNILGNSEFAWSDKERIRKVVRAGALGGFGRWYLLGTAQCEVHTKFPGDIGTDLAGDDTKCLKIWVKSTPPYSINTAFPVENLACGLLPW